MTSFDSKIVNLMASKLGIDSESVLKRASEFLRLLQLRVTASTGLRQFSDTSRVVMCLDLACNRLSYPFDKTNLFRLAGLNKKQYTSGLNLLENLLDLSKPVDVSTLCVQLGVSEVASCAQKILDKYAEQHSHGPNGGRPLDMTLPVYHCVAVLLACKYNKVKVDKPKLVDASRVKRTQFDKLVEEVTPILETLGIRDGKKVATKRSHKLIDLVSKFDEETKETNGRKTEKQTDNADSEDFEAWKKRILCEAGDNAS